VRPLSGQNPPYLPLKQDGGSVSRSSPCPWRALRSPGLAGCRPDTQAREQRGRGLGAEPKRPGAARERADTPVTEQERARAVERALTVTVSCGSVRGRGLWVSGQDDAGCCLLLFMLQLLRTSAGGRALRQHAHTAEARRQRAKLPTG
ncbi:hypothetical protein XENOCAPTIV_025468, partial [Xenoophorus captivus]